jgi:hypothetical protein
MPRSLGVYMEARSVAERSEIHVPNGFKFYWQHKSTGAVQLHNSFAYKGNVCQLVDY